MSTWKFTNRRTGEKIVSPIQAYWEANYDTISDDYSPAEIDALDLFKLWVDKVMPIYPDKLIPICWFVKFSGKPENMPFQFNHGSIFEGQDFLTYFTSPVHVQTQEPLNWTTVHVVDKLWNSEHSTKGGFIQQTTGWKPSVLQPYVYLPTLTNMIT